MPRMIVSEQMAKIEYGFGKNVIAAGKEMTGGWSYLLLRQAVSANSRVGGFAVDPQ